MWQYKPDKKDFEHQKLIHDLFRGSIIMPPILTWKCAGTPLMFAVSMSSGVTVSDLE